MSTTRAQAYQAVEAALSGLAPAGLADVAAVGLEACLLVIAHERGTQAAARAAYELADALATAECRACRY